MLRHSIVKFASVGVINTLLTLLIIFSLKSLLDVADASANFIGYLAGLSCSFILNKRWTFTHEGSALAALLRFFMVFALSYSLNIILVLSSIRWGVNEYLAHLTGIPVYSLTFYYGCRYFAFRPSSMQPASQAVAYSSWVWFVATLSLAAIILGYRLGDLPIEVWDEARLAINALEMSHSGSSLITTYAGQPDHWNTKPPLLIWLMVLAIKVLGATELAVRLPSFMAALATVALMFAFCTHVLKRPVIGFWAVVLLMATPGYVQIHGARSGNYDALLTLWTTGFLLAAYLYMQKDRGHKAVWLGLCTLGIILAFFTKTIVGLIFLPPLLIYALWVGALGNILKSAWFYVNLLAIVVLCVGYYLLRDVLDSGYLQAAWANDLLGRFSGSLENHTGGPFYYVWKKLYPWLGLSVLTALMQFRYGKEAELRQVSLFLGLAILFFVGIISAAETKLMWYALPVTPLSALIIAIAGYQLWDYWVQQPGLLPRLLHQGRSVCLLLASSAVLLQNYLAYNAFAATFIQVDADQYSFFLRSAVMKNKDINKFALIYQGYDDGYSKDYAGPALFYVTKLRHEGREIAIVSPLAQLPTDFNTFAACGNTAKQALAAQATLRQLASEGNCGLYARESVTTSVEPSRL